MLAAGSPALTRTVWRGCARASATSWRSPGERATALKLIPAYPDARGKGLVQIDGIARENAGAGLDERVEVEPLSRTPVP